LRFLKGTGISSSLIIIQNFFKRAGTGGSLILAFLKIQNGEAAVLEKFKQPASTGIHI
jgi:hypothetical protein